MASEPATLPLRRNVTVSVRRRESVDAAAPRTARATVEAPSTAADRSHSLPTRPSTAAVASPALAGARTSRPSGGSSHAPSVLPSAGFFSPKRAQARPSQPDPNSAGSDHTSFVASSTAPSTKPLVAPLPPNPDVYDLPEVHVRRQDAAGSTDLLRSPSVTSHASHVVGPKPSREPLLAYPTNAAIPGSPSKARQSPTTATKGEGGFGDLEKAAFAPPARSDSFRSFRSVRDRRGRKMRNWQFHDGSNRFFLAGRLMSSDDSMLYLLGSTTVATLLPILFLVFNAGWMWSDFPRADGQGGAEGGIKFAVVLFGYLTLMMWASLARTAFRDPGIIPRGLHEPEVERIACPIGAHEDMGGGFAERPVARYVKVRDDVVTSKCPSRDRCVGSDPLPDCETCRSYRPPRSSHCRLCDDCVSRVDHHCVFLNTCVGERTYSSFITFLVSTTLCVLLAVSFSVAHIALANQAGAGPFSSWQQIGALIVAVAALFVGLPVIGLLGYHCRLLWLGRTTIEMLRPITGDRADKSMYSHGSHLADIIATLCRPTEAPSFIAPRAYARRDVRLGTGVNDDRKH